MTRGYDSVACRDRLAIALDMDDLVAAIRLARAVSDHFRVAKVGLELFGAAGPEAVGAMLDLGYDVFCDLKLHDIPNTVNRCARVLGELGVSYVTAHAAGGLEMLEAAAAGLAAGSAASGASDVSAPAEGRGALAAVSSGASGASACLLAVTVLTSEARREATAELVASRMELASRAGCGGVVCAAPDLIPTRGVAPELLRVVPGIRLPGDPRDDQRRVAAPAQALAQGADLLVVGRSVTRAPDPREAAGRLHRSLGA